MTFVTGLFSCHAALDYYRRNAVQCGHMTVWEAICAFILSLSLCHY
jgi:hypothetical protein